MLDGRTGRLVPLDDVESFAEAMRGIDDLDFSAAAARENAERFSVGAFQRKLSEEIERAQRLAREN